MLWRKSVKAISCGVGNSRHQGRVELPQSGKRPDQVGKVLGDELPQLLLSLIRNHL